MGATRDDISRWFDQGHADGATHMIVVCDTYDHEDYPVYVMPGTDLRKTFDLNNGPNMTRAMECYALWKPKDPQMGQYRVMDFEAKPLTPQADREE